MRIPSSRYARCSRPATRQGERHERRRSPGAQRRRTQGRARAVRGDATSPACLVQVDTPVDLIFVDPPYPMMRQATARQRVLEQIGRCRRLMGESGFVVLRGPLPPTDYDSSIQGFDGPEVHEYGRSMWVSLYAPSAVDAETGESE